MANNKAEIIKIGKAHRRDDGSWLVTGWHMRGGDYPGVASDHLGGWTPEQLAAIEQAERMNNE